MHEGAISKLVVSNIFYFQLENLGKIPKLTKMFQMGCKPPSKFVKTLINDKQGTKSTD